MQPRFPLFATLLLIVPTVAAAQNAVLPAPAQEAAPVISPTPQTPPPAPSAEGEPTAPNVPPVPSTAPDAKVLTPNEATSTTIPDRIGKPLDVREAEEKAMQQQQQRKRNEVKSGTLPATVTPDGRGSTPTPTTPRRNPVWNGVDGKADPR